MYDYEGCEKLAIAVIQSATEDYKKLYKKFRKNHDKEMDGKLKLTRNFILDGVYIRHFAIDGSGVIQKLETEVEEKLYKAWLKDMKFFNHGRC